MTSKHNKKSGSVSKTIIIKKSMRIEEITTLKIRRSIVKWTVVGIILNKKICIKL